jgi:hypothetical protein
MHVSILHLGLGDQTVLEKLLDHMKGDVLSVHVHHHGCDTGVRGAGDYCGLEAFLIDMLWHIHWAHLLVTILI